jgi:LysR family transcriptional regulator, transcriptional activator of nhaA
MDWLNYHHLLYFWVTAREGSVMRAAEQLHLTQPTVSGQLRALETALGEKLFVRSGRGLAMTEFGRTVFAYADEIFALGRELLDTVRGRPTGRPLRLLVGVADVLPKIVAYRLLEPALDLPEPVRLVCHEATPEQLLGELAVHKLDLVLSDTPIGSSVKVRAFNHVLGESGATVFGVPKLAAVYRRGFPRSLDRAPLLLPLEGSALRRSLEAWLDSLGLRPQVAGEFEDSALLKEFGQSGRGLFLAPTVIEEEVQRRYGVQRVGRIAAVTERFYAISPERRLKNPAVVAICETARRRLFG